MAVKGIQGTYFKRWLPKVSSKDTLWEDWEERFPKSQILNLKTAVERPGKCI